MCTLKPLIITAWAILSLRLSTALGRISVKPELMHPSPCEASRTLLTPAIYKLEVNGSALTFQLHRRYTGLRNKIYVSDNLENTAAFVQAEDDLGFYQDPDNMAAVSLRHSGNSGQCYHDITGTFIYNGSFFNIKPIDIIRQRRTGERTENHHFLEEMPNFFGETDYIRPPNEKVGRKTYNQPWHESREIRGSSAERYARQLKPQYEVHLMYVTDYSFYKSFEAVIRANNPQATMSQVVREIQFYLSHVENQVDLRYRRINTPDWSISTVLVGLVIDPTPSLSYWTESLTEPGITQNKLAVNASSALNLFRKWVFSPATGKNISLPKFDHAALFTGYDIYGTGYSNTKTYSTTGLAFTSAMCTIYSTSIIEFNGALSEGHIQAHELGHSLGASHDGVDNMCLPSDQYIMTAQSTYSATVSNQNQFIFSTCSLASFRTYISSLNSEGKNCMRDSLPQYNQMAWNLDMSIPPGQHYSVDVQCQQAFGTTYAACGGKRFGTNVCSQLWCYDTSATGSVTCYSVPGSGGAMDGTTCGNKKWCWQAKCVYNESAPSGSDTCPLGDFTKDQPIYSNQPYTCSNAPSYVCYDKDGYDTCCRSCAQMYNANSPSCPYGDKSDCSGATLISCRSSSFNATCCQYCQVNRLDIQNCELGDYYSNCGLLVPSICATSYESCCQSCYQLDHPNWKPPNNIATTSATVTASKTHMAGLPSLPTLGDTSVVIFYTDRTVSSQFPGSSQNPGSLACSCEPLPISVNLCTAILLLFRIA